MSVWGNKFPSHFTLGGLEVIPDLKIEGNTSTTCVALLFCSIL